MSAFRFQINLAIRKPYVLRERLSSAIQSFGLRGLMEEMPQLAPEMRSSSHERGNELWALRRTGMSIVGRLRFAAIVRSAGDNFAITAIQSAG